MCLLSSSFFFLLPATFPLFRNRRFSSVRDNEKRNLKMISLCVFNPPKKPRGNKRGKKNKSRLWEIREKKEKKKKPNFPFFFLGKKREYRKTSFNKSENSSKCFLESSHELNELFIIIHGDMIYIIKPNLFRLRSNVIFLCVFILKIVSFFFL